MAYIASGMMPVAWLKGNIPETSWQKGCYWKAIFTTNGVMSLMVPKVQSPSENGNGTNGTLLSDYTSQSSSDKVIGSLGGVSIFGPETVNQSTWGGNPSTCSRLSLDEQHHAVEFGDESVSLASSSRAWSKEKMVFRKVKHPCEKKTCRWWFRNPGNHRIKPCK